MEIGHQYLRYLHWLTYKMCMSQIDTFGFSAETVIFIFLNVRVKMLKYHVSNVHIVI